MASQFVISPAKMNPTKGRGVVVVVKNSIANSIIVGLDNSKENDRG